MTWIVPIIGVIVSILWRHFFKSEPTADTKWLYFSLGGGVVGTAWLGVALIDKLKITFIDLMSVLLGGAVFYYATVLRNPVTPVPSVPAPQSVKRADKPHWLPWRNQTGTDAAMFQEGGAVGPEGVEATVDMPDAMWKENIASRRLGCCVFRSLSECADWQNVPTLHDVPEWMVSKGIPGGGTPQKVDLVIKQVCADRGIPSVGYLQITDGDPSKLEQILSTGRLVAVTYNGHDTHYGLNKSISHMVNLVYLDPKYACIRDSNFPKTGYWMTRQEFISRWQGGGGWGIALFAPPPPDPPRNK